jgi:XTP/dITP diphosphohydrolase
MEIVVATRNKKKLEEINRILKGLPVVLLTLDDFPSSPDVEESEVTFEGNAVKKAKEISEYTSMPALADDSGLEVDALEGAPGVYSARYAGPDASDRENLERLLRELGSVPDGGRGARFVCVLALALPDGEIETFIGTVEGIIGKEPLGKSGFGYDPVFYPEGHERTFAQMSPAEKDSMSHRGRALEKLREYLIGSIENWRQ